MGSEFFTMFGMSLQKTGGPAPETGSAKQRGAPAGNGRGDRKVSRRTSIDEKRGWDAPKLQKGRLEGKAYRISACASPGFVMSHDFWQYQKS